MLAILIKCNIPIRSIKALSLNKLCTICYYLIYCRFTGPTLPFIKNSQVWLMRLASLAITLRHVVTARSNSHKFKMVQCSLAPLSSSKIMDVLSTIEICQNMYSQRLRCFCLSHKQPGELQYSNLIRSWCTLGFKHGIVICFEKFSNVLR